MIGAPGFRLVLVLCLLGLPGLQACGDAAPGGDPDGAGPAAGSAADESRVVPVVAVPVAPMAGLVEAIAPPGAADVVVLVPPGANPATYEPALEALRRTAGARIYFGLGHPAFVFERSWLDGLLGGSEAERVELFVDCPVVGDDYHVWLSASCVGDAARRAAETLVRVLPDVSRDDVEGRLADFLGRVAATDSVTGSRLEPNRGDAFVVLHPAWGYLARPYELTQLSILSHGTGDPGPGRVAELIERARSSGVRHVFIQPQFNRAPARLVAEEIDAELVMLDPLQRDPLAAIDEATAALATEFAERGKTEESR